MKFSIHLNRRVFVMYDRYAKAIVIFQRRDEHFLNILEQDWKGLKLERYRQVQRYAFARLCVGGWMGE